MYTKDKTHRITLRLNEEQHSFVCENAEMLGVSPSDFLRMVINASLATVKKAASRLERASDNLINSESEGQGRENDEANQHDLI